MDRQTADSAKEVSWNELIDYIEQICKHVHQSQGDISQFKKDILNKLELYKSNEQDFKPFVSFDQERFTKNLVAEFEGSCNVILMCWLPGQSSSVHSHNSAKCHVKILKGQLKELQMPCPNECRPSVRVDLDRNKARSLKLDDVTYIDDEIGAHWVTNESKEEPAISLHIYSPPYKQSITYTPLESNGGTKLTQQDRKFVDLNCRVYEQTIKKCF